MEIWLLVTVYILLTLCFRS